MRSVILIAAIASLTAGAAFAQYDAKQPASPPTAQAQRQERPGNHLHRHPRQVRVLPKSRDFH